MNWKRLRKPVAIIAALALIVGLFPAYAVADDTGNTRGAGGEYAIGIYYDEAQGTVTAMVDDVATTSADGGDLVYLVIEPASGYSYSSAGVTVTNSDGESVQTVPQDDGTVSFQMPN